MVHSCLHSVAATHQSSPQSLTIVRELREELRAAYLRNSADIDAMIDALPNPFQERIYRFRQANKDFRYMCEEQEVFVSRHALIIADRFPDPTSIEAFYNASYANRARIACERNIRTSYIGLHTATHLAYFYKSGELEKLTHVCGVKALWLGCTYYGCLPKNIR